MRPSLHHPEAPPWGKWGKLFSPTFAEAVPALWDVQAVPALSWV